MLAPPVRRTAARQAPVVTPNAGRKTMSDQPSTNPDRNGRKRRIVVRVAAALVIALAIDIALVLRPGQRPSTPPPTASERNPAALATSAAPFDQGLALLLFLTPDCGHCLQVARSLATFKAVEYGLSLYGAFLGQEDEVDTFFQETGTEFPYVLVPPETYAAYTREDPPTIYLLDQGSVRAQWTGSQFNRQALIEALPKTKQTTVP